MHQLRRANNSISEIKSTLMYNSHVASQLTHTKTTSLVNAFFQIYILVVILVFSWMAIKLIKFPYGLDYGEAPIIDQFRRIQNHQVLYKSDLNSPPYVIANYPPLYPALIAGLQSFLHTPVFQTGRCISLFFSIMSGILIGLFGYHLTQKKICGAMAAVIFLGNPYVTFWSSLARVDMMALAFSLLGLYILFRRRDSLPWIILACACFLVAIFTRQTYLLSAPLAGFVWLFHLNHRKAWLYLAMLGISTLLIFGTINALTQGGFYLNIIAANVNPYDFTRAAVMLRQLLVIWPVILIATGYILVISILKSRQGQNVFGNEISFDPFLTYGLPIFGMAALIVAFTAGKIGSNVNYFLELIAAGAICTGIAISMLMDRMASKQSLIILGLFFIQFIWVIIASLPLTWMAIESRWKDLPYLNNLYQRITVATHHGIVLSDDYMDMIVLSGQPVYYQPFEYGQLYRAEMWDPAELTKQVEGREFPLIVIGGNTLDKDCCWPTQVTRAFQEQYQVETEPDSLLLTPKQ